MNVLEGKAMFQFKKSLILPFLFVFVLMGIVVSTLVVSGPMQVQAKSVTKLSVQFTCADAVDYKAGEVCVHTQGNAALTIKVKYCSGKYATSKSLKGTVHTKAAGNYTWRWEPETKCRGTATAYVTETLSGHTLNASKSFKVK
jgi:hypothetical protein